MTFFSMFQDKLENNIGKQQEKGQNGMKWLADVREGVLKLVSLIDKTKI